MFGSHLGYLTKGNPSFQRAVDLTMLPGGQGGGGLHQSRAICSSLAKCNHAKPDKLYRGICDYFNWYFCFLWEKRGNIITTQAPRERQIQNIRRNTVLKEMHRVLRTEALTALCTGALVKVLVPVYRESRLGKMPPTVLLGGFKCFCVRG